MLHALMDIDDRGWKDLVQRHHSLEVRGSAFGMLAAV
jgi:hypothetical protein